MNVGLMVMNFMQVAVTVVVATATKVAMAADMIAMAVVAMAAKQVRDFVQT